MKPLTRRIVVFFGLLLLFAGMISNPTLAEIGSINDAYNSSKNTQLVGFDSTQSVLLEQETILSLASYSAIPEAFSVTSGSQVLEPYLLTLPHVSLEGLLTTIYLTNLSDIAAQAAIMFLNPDGSEALSIGSIALPARALLSFHLDELTLQAGYEGSAIVSTSGPVATVVILKSAYGNDLLGYKADNYGSTTVYFPRIMRNWFGWNSDLWIQNAGSAAADVTLHFMSANGGIIHELGDTIPVYASHVYHASEISALGDNFSGWVWVTASEPVSGVAEERDSASDRAAAYPSILQGSQDLLSTWQLKDNNGLYSNIRILNPGDFPDNLLTEFIYFTGYTYHSQADSVNPGGLLDLNLSTITELPDGFNGTASMTSLNGVMGTNTILGLPVVGKDNYSVNPLISRDFSSGITIPVVIHDAEQGLRTEISAYNHGGTEASVTVSFFNQDGVIEAFFADSIPAKRTVRYSTDDISWPGTSWEGSASILITEGQEIYGEALLIVSQVGYSISGSVIDSNDQPLPEVLISTDAGNSAFSGATGAYEVSGVLTGTYTLTPSKAGYTFSPASRTVSVPPDATGVDFVGTATTPRLKLLIVPLDWQDTQQAFDLAAQTQTDIFLDEVPLNACRDRVLVDTLSVTTENFEGFTCSLYNCGLSSIRTFVQYELNIDPADYDVIVGLAESSSCPPIAGCSNGTDTIWVSSQYDIVTAHELGHIYNLEDEYCSNQAGSTDSRCNDGDIQGDGALTGDVNWLDASLPYDCPADGSNDSSDSPCCNFGSYQCNAVNYGVCCLGNKNAAGGRSTMSYANAPEPRGFDVHDLAHLNSLPQLSCGAEVNSLLNSTTSITADGSQVIIDVNLLLHPDGSVTSGDISIQYGLPTSASVLEGMLGDYELKIVDSGGHVAWSQEFDVYFDYQGPVVLDEDYSSISFDTVDVSFRVPQACGMQVLELYHEEELLFSEDLPPGCMLSLPLILNTP